MIVVDANLISYMLLQSEFTALAEAVFNKDSHWIAPVLWRSEFRNVMCVYLKRKLITLESAKTAMEVAEAIITAGEKVDSNVVLEAAVTLDLSAYDAEYYVTAKHYAVPLVTHDKKLLKTDLAVSMEDFVRG